MRVLRHIDMDMLLMRPVIAWMLAFDLQHCTGLEQLMICIELACNDQRGPVRWEGSLHAVKALLCAHTHLPLQKVSLALYLGRFTVDWLIYVTYIDVGGWGPLEDALLGFETLQQVEIHVNSLRHPGEEYRRAMVRDCIEKMTGLHARGMLSLKF